MATVYDFANFRTVRHLRKHSQMAGDAACKTRVLNEMLDTITRLLLRNKRVLSNVDANLELHQTTLERSVEFTNLCEMAWELDDVDKMTDCYKKLSRNKGLGCVGKY